MASKCCCRTVGALLWRSGGSQQVLLSDCRSSSLVVCGVSDCRSSALVVWWWPGRCSCRTVGAPSSGGLAVASEVLLSGCRSSALAVWWWPGRCSCRTVGAPSSGGLAVASNKLLSDGRNSKLWQSGGLSGLRALAVMLDSA